MERFKVVQVINDGNPTPNWVAERLEVAGIDFSVAICWSQEDLAHYADDADMVWAYGGRHLLAGDNLSVLKKCKAILRTGSGTDNIDIMSATAIGIIVANTPQAVTDPVSDHAISLLFSLVRQIACHDRLIRGGQWNYRLAMPGRRFQGSTLGLIGFGRVPRCIVSKLSGFQMRFVAYDPYVSAEVIASHGAESLALDELLRTADYVSLHCPSTQETHTLIGERELRLMQPHSLLINTARGVVCGEQALIKTLQGKWIAGAALDVLEKEPPDPHNALLGMTNVILTPHYAGFADTYPREFCEASIEAILDVAQGRWPYSVVNPDVRPRSVFVHR